MLEIGFVGFGRIVVNQRFITLGIGGVQAVQFGKDNRLNNGKSLCPAVFEKLFRFLLVQSMQKFPCRISQVEKRSSVFMNQITVILRYFQLAMAEINRRAPPRL